MIENNKNNYNQLHENMGDSEYTYSKEYTIFSYKQ